MSPDTKLSLALAAATLAGAAVTHYAGEKRKALEATRNATVETDATREITSRIFTARIAGGAGLAIAVVSGGLLLKGLLYG